MAKLAAVLGVDADQVLDVDLGLGGADVLEVLRTAVAEHRRVHLDYYSYGRDARTERDVDPYLVHAEDGSLYVLGHCHLAGAERRFRVDRIAAATLLDERFEPPATDRAGRRVPARRRRPARRARARRRRRRGWPRPTRSEQVETRPDGTLRVRLAVAAEAWFERLLVGLGPAGPGGRRTAVARGRGAARERRASSTATVDPAVTDSDHSAHEDELRAELRATLERTSSRPTAVDAEPPPTVDRAVDRRP